MKKLTCISVFIVLLGCRGRSICNLEMYAEDVTDLHLPLIDTVGQMSTAFRFQKSELNASQDAWKFDNESSVPGNVGFFVDDNREVQSKYSTPYLVLNLDFVDSNGNVIKNPYQPPFDTLAMFPCFIYNCTTEKQFLLGSDGMLIAVQEALGEDNKWHPIEKFEYSGCGNSFHFVPIPSQSYLMVPIYKYSGNFKTKLRLKVVSKDSIYYSNTFEGKINKSQLETRKLNFSESYLTDGNGYI